MEFTPVYYLIPSLVMFCCGVYGFLTRRNMIAMLISIELMLNAVDINFVVFNRYLFPGSMEGMMFTLFAIGIAAAETALAIAIIINLYRVAKNIDVHDITQMKF
ncbi:MAG: NADH-quinone oxidoreductase subunit NuoK [Duncaniella sp.]|nr:NADH-quinone oxidoreductase subunit NuoK [Duncaniella sp.]MDE5983306.1 NADH-quinone oxidoreductase subunit NuoK [Duncaniella sp.]MDE6325575.1 NADH-quinone oxidoreductase subunit NuoK [Duncaniella sp.]MDE6495137.1 NADH-quinone oxidoreductase subunit NuoK [Duncaniella sp.]HBI57768.1 NADH-quinone oxidoreductase subunit NuoK [Porphyromonadaceae bacterium]